MAKAKTTTPENDVSNVLAGPATVGHNGGPELSKEVEAALDGTNPVDGPKELTPEEHEAAAVKAAVKAAVEASGIYHLNTFFNQMLRTAQKADDAIKADPRTTTWTLPEIEKLFFSLRG